MFDIGGSTVELVERCRKAAGTDVSFASDAVLCAAAVELEAGVAALQAAQLHVLAELESRELCDRQFGLSTGSWLADRARLPHGLARSRVRTATKLRRALDQVDDALSDGRISFDHAKALADAANPRITDHVTEHQSELVDHAQHAPFAIWRRNLAEQCELWDQDGGYDPARDRARNRLHLTPVGDTLAVTGELVGETAVIVDQVIERAADRLFRQYHRDHELAPDCELPPRATLRAEALADICRRSEGTEPGQAPGTDVTLVAHLHAPELLDHAEPPTTEPGSTPPASRPIDASNRLTLRTPNGHRLDPERYAHLLCDPVLHPLLVDHRQIPLALGLAARLATPGQRRALAIRDGGCVFPGCDRPPGWCDAHHVQPHDQLGPTDLPNLALLCRYHHGVTHRRGWMMQADLEGGFRWTTPAGLVLRNQASSVSRPGDPPCPADPSG